MTIVDISKAFDTVPHTMTGDKHLKAKGVLTIVSRYVEKCTKTQKQQYIAGAKKR